MRDGPPLENFWGVGGGGEVQKKMYSRRGKLNEKYSYTLSNAKKIFTQRPKKFI